MKLTPERAWLAAVALVLALLAGACAWAWHSVDRLADDAAEAEQAQQVLTGLAAIHSALLDAESSRHGQVISGDPAFGDHLLQAREQLRTSLDGLRPLLARQSEQYVRLVALGPLLDRRLDNLAARPDTRNRNAAAWQAETTNEGRRLQDRVRVAVADLQLHGADQLARARQRSADSAGRSRTAVALAGGLTWLVAGLALWQWGRVRSILRRTLGHRQDDNTQLRLQSEALDQLFKGPAAALCVLDAEGRFVRVGSACDKLWGWKADDLMGTPYIDKVWPDDRRKTEQALAAAATGTTAPALRHRWRKADGSLAHLQWGWLPLGADGQLMGVAIDQSELQGLRITTTKAAEALRQATAELDTGREQLQTSAGWQASFLAALDQALGPPSTRLLELAAQAQHGGIGPLEDAQRQHWASTAEQAKTLHEAVQDALDIGRIEAGQLNLDRESFDMWETLIQVAARARALADRKGLALQVQLAENLGYARGDARRVEQLLMRVLRSAIDATPTGQVLLQASRQGDGPVCISVADGRGETGQAALAVALNPAPTALGEPAAPGALGLALARRLVQLMNGQFGVEQASAGGPGAGWVFKVTLPVDEVGKA